MEQFEPSLVKKALDKARKQLKNAKAIIKFYIPRSLNTVNSVTVILEGIVDDGSRKGKITTLQTEVNKTGDTTAAKIAVLNKYING